MPHESHGVGMSPLSCYDNRLNKLFRVIQEPPFHVRLHEPTSSFSDLRKVHCLEHRRKCHKLQKYPLLSTLEICGHFLPCLAWHSCIKPLHLTLRKLDTTAVERRRIVRADPQKRRPPSTGAAEQTGCQ